MKRKPFDLKSTKGGIKLICPECQNEDIIPTGEIKKGKNRFHIRCRNCRHYRPVEIVL